MRKNYKYCSAAFPTGKGTKTKVKNKNRHFYGRKFILIPIFLFLGFGMAKGQKIDSLKSLLHEKSGLERCDILYQLAYEYVDVDNSLGLQYAKEALKAANEHGDSLKIVRAGRIKSLAYRRLGEMDSAMNLSIEILPIALRQNYTDELKHILNGLALVYTFEAYYDKALKCYFQSLEFSDKLGDKLGTSNTLQNVGLVYYKLEDYDKALSYYEHSLRLKREINSDYDLAYLLVNISLCYAYKNNFYEAQNFVQQGFSLCDKNCSKVFLLTARFCLGVISFGLKNFLDAEIQFLKSYAIAKELDDERFQLDNVVYLSKIYIQRNQLVLAESYLREAEKLIASGTPYNLELIKVYNSLFKLYTKSSNFQKVALYQQKYIQLKDSIYSEELTRNLMKIEAEYLERENNAKIEAQNKILALNDEVIFRQRFLNAFIGIIAVLLVILAIVLIKNNRQKRLTNQLLEQKVKERTKELEHNRDALKRSLDERTIVFQKVSTDIKSSLATIKGLCSIGLKDLDAPDTGQYIRKIDVTSDQLLGILSRTFANTLLVD